MGIGHNDGKCKFKCNCNTIIMDRLTLIKMFPFFINKTV